MNCTITSVGGRAPPAQNTPTPCARSHLCASAHAPRAPTPSCAGVPRSSGHRGARYRARCRTHFRSVSAVHPSLPAIDSSRPTRTGAQPRARGPAAPLGLRGNTDSVVFQDLRRATWETLSPSVARRARSPPGSPRSPGHVFKGDRSRRGRWTWEESYDSIVPRSVGNRSPRDPREGRGEQGDVSVDGPMATHRGRAPCPH